MIINKINIIEDISNDDILKFFFLKTCVNKYVNTALVIDILNLVIIK